MNSHTIRFLLYASLLLIVGCSDSSSPLGSNSTASTSFNTVLFDPTANSSSSVPLPNILATASAKDPFLNYSGLVQIRPAGRPMNPLEALAYVNTYEVGGTHAVAGLNAPIYIRFSSPVDTSTVTADNVKVFELTPDSSGAENNPLGFTDVSPMFEYRYTAGSTDLFLFPKFPLKHASRYMYLVTSRVKDAVTGGSVGGSVYFEALKSTLPLSGSFAALEPIRANVYVDAAKTVIKLSGYAKVMNDLITASATTSVTSRNDISVLGRFITTGAGFVSRDGTGSTASMMPVESALRAFAAGAGLGGLPGKTWTNSISGTVTLPTAAYWSAIPGAGSAPASVSSVVTGTFNSAELSIDPVIARANSTTTDLSAVSAAYNPAAGVVQAFRSGGNLTGFYHSVSSVPFVYLVPTTPNGKTVIFQHGITGQKEQVVAVAGALTAAGYAVVAIDLPLHGALAVPTHTSSDVWGQDFMAIGAPLATRSNIQQAAFNLNRLEFTLKTGALIAAGVTSVLPTEIKFVGLSLGSIVGAYYLAGNTTLATSGLPYTQTTLNGDMKGFLSVPGGRLAYLIQNSPAFSPSVNAGLLAQALIATGSPTYHQFFQATQSIVDPVDPATMTTPLASGLPSRLSGRIAIQEATSTAFGSTGIPTNGDLVITNPYTRYLGNALGGREVLGAAGAALAPAFKQLGYRGGTEPRIPSSFMFTLTGGVPTPKVDFAAAQSNLAATTPAEGYFQFDQDGVGHGFLLDPTTSPAGTQFAQSQMVNFLLRGVIVDPTPTGVAKLATAAQVPAIGYEVRVPPVMKIFGY